MKKGLLNLTYVVILAKRSFYIVIAIVVYFNLKIRKYNIIRVFLNIKFIVVSLVIYKILDRLKKKIIYV